MASNTTIITEAQLARQKDFSEKVRAYWAMRGRQPRAYIDTYGCQQNEADSERMLGMLLAMGYAAQEAPENADVIIINTCAVREHAEQRVFGNLGALTHTKRRPHGGSFF